MPEENPNRYVCLLRGINVGGKNLIKMSALAALFESLGFGGVQTYIQSGNVLFATREPEDPARLAETIEAALSQAFAYSARVALRSHPQLRRVVSEAPPGFGSDPATYRYDVIFLKEPLGAPEALAAVQAIPPKEGVDQVFAGPGVLYHSRLARLASQSRMSRLIGLPIYPHLTIRNWNTTTKLLALLEAA